jgi:META domain
MMLSRRPLQWCLLAAVALLATVGSIPTREFIGDYVLSKVFINQTVPVPVNGNFSLSLQWDTYDNHSLFYHLVIGNDLTCSIRIVNDSQKYYSRINITTVFSTRKMPPRDQMILEDEISDMLPAMRTLTLRNDTLKLNGTKGYILSKRVQSSHDEDD